MRPSRHTLLGRVHEQVRLEAQHEVEALYAFIDPVLRSRREAQRDDARELAISGIRAFVESVRSAEVEEVEILHARKACAHQAGRSAALVRSVVRYDSATAGELRTELHTVWVRDHGVWYSTGEGGPRA